MFKRHCRLNLQVFAGKNVASEDPQRIKDTPAVNFSSLLASGMSLFKRLTERLCLAYQASL